MVDFSLELANWGSNVGCEARKSFRRWLEEGFYEKYLSGANVLDIGFKGYEDNIHPITPSGIGVDLDYPGYDGSRLPFPDGSQDAVFASHVLEHISDYKQALADWFRVIKVGGHLIILVPHQFLYERKAELPSRWNGDHRRFYTAGSLLREVEESINPIWYRVRVLEDNDRGFNYRISPEFHADGCYEIVLVIEKILPDHVGQILSSSVVRSVQDVLSLDDAEFIEESYLLLLQRHADPGGLEHYIQELGRGASRMAIWHNFATCDEARSRNITVPGDVAIVLEQNGFTLEDKAGRN